MNHLEPLQNAADSNGLKVHEDLTQDKRKKIPKFFVSLNGISISPVLDYENMNHFILGFNKAVFICSHIFLIQDTQYRLLDRML